MSTIEVLDQIRDCIDRGDFEIAEKLCARILEEVENQPQKTENTYTILFNLAGHFIDLGHMVKKSDLSRLGLELMVNNREHFLSVVSASNFFYNLANAKSDLISFVNTFDLSFHNIEELVEVKNYFWKSFKENRLEGNEKPELLVNLSNSLKRQFRISESLRYYDMVNEYNLDIPQSWVNRSDTLKILNHVSEGYSVKLLFEVIDGYKVASESKNLPSSWADHYRKVADYHETQLVEMGHNIKSDEDEEATAQEYEQLSDYRKFCIKNYLTISEHGLYCGCAGSARDNLTIPLLHKNIAGDFVPQMETVLNRIKSEYSLARRNYYEYLHQTEEELELLHEDCFTELLNEEILGIPVEKLRTSFRICFGILDKIALAICTIYDVRPKGQIYFQNFWRLNDANRKDKFESIKNPGLLALYSIATDLNMHKDGEWSCFKDWRNSLEHGLFVIVENDINIDPYKSFGLSEDVEIVKINDFLYFLEQMLQLTRSAIFSFVFSVRHLAIQSSTEHGILCELDRKNFTSL